MWAGGKNGEITPGGGVGTAFAAVKYPIRLDGPITHCSRSHHVMVWTHSAIPATEFKPSSACTHDVDVRQRILKVDYHDHILILDV